MATNIPYADYPAFPRPASIGNNYATGEEGVVVDPQKGMTIRDYFAAKAMGGFMAIDADERCREDTCETIKAQATVIAEMAYAVADAMILQREK